MAAGAVVLYAANIDDLRLQDLVGATLKMALLTSSYTPSDGTSGHSVYADLTNELSTAFGYTAGGDTLTTVAVTASGDGWKLTTDDAVWTASGGNIPAWRYGAIYVEGTLWGKTNPLLGYFLGDSTPADVPATSDGNPLTIECNASGWFDIVRV